MKTFPHKGVARTLAPSLIALALPALLSACGQDVAARDGASEVLASRAWNETLAVDGEIKAAADTPLAVPGSGWQTRRLVEMVPDGGFVQKGQVVARFDAPQARMELSQAETELLRKTLAELEIEAGAQAEQRALAADGAKVDADLGMSRRYANIDLSIFARNFTLDALADVGFLSDKRAYLDWKKDQAQARSGAQEALLRSQRDSVSQNADEKRRSLASLELTAPHDGVFLLAAGWDGSKPQIGSNQTAGQPFGSLPDMERLNAHFSVPEGQAYGLKTGLPVRVRLAGTGTEIELSVTALGNSASARSGESPVKYSEFDAAVPPDVARRLKLQPGQALRGQVSLVARPAALTVPNIALVQEGAGYAVYTEEGGRQVRHAVELGLRGPVRSELKSGPAAGARIVLLPGAAKEKS